MQNQFQRCKRTLRHNREYRFERFLFLQSLFSAMKFLRFISSGIVPFSRSSKNLSRCLCGNFLLSLYAVSKFLTLYLFGRRVNRMPSFTAFTARIAALRYGYVMTSVIIHFGIRIISLFVFVHFVTLLSFLIAV